MMVRRVPRKKEHLPMRLVLFAAVAVVALSSSCAAQPQTAAGSVKPSAEWKLAGRAMISAADKRAV
jgi:hypothetical protein